MKAILTSSALISLTLVLGCDRLSAIIDAKRGATSPDGSAQATAEPPASAQAAASAAATPTPETAASAEAAASATPAPSASVEESTVNTCATAIGTEHADPLQNDCTGIVGSCSKQASCRDLIQAIRSACRKTQNARCAKYDKVIDARCDVRRIDWLNHFYPAELFTPTASPSTEKKADVFVARGRAKTSDASVQVDSVEFGDLDGDGATEAYVKYKVTPLTGDTSLTSTSVAVFEGTINCQVRLLDTERQFVGPTTKVVGNVVFAVDGKKLVGTWDGLDAAGKPVAVRGIWGLRNDRLAQTSQKEAPVPGAEPAGAGDKKPAGESPATETEKPASTQEPAEEKPAKKRRRKAKDADD